MLIPCSSTITGSAKLKIARIGTDREPCRIPHQKYYRTSFDLTIYTFDVVQYTCLTIEFRCCSSGTETCILFIGDWGKKMEPGRTWLYPTTIVWLSTVQNQTMWRWQWAALTIPPIIQPITPRFMGLHYFSSRINASRPVQHIYAICICFPPDFKLLVALKL